MWDSLAHIYSQDNEASSYQLELDLSEYCQGTKSVQEYYSGFVSLWAEYDEIVYNDLSDAEASTLQKFQKKKQWDQFLMKLRKEYETIRSNLTSRESTPSLDQCLGELLREEQRCLITMAMEQKGRLQNSSDVAYATQTWSRDCKE